MPRRIVVNCATGQTEEFELTPSEVTALNARVVDGETRQSQNQQLESDIKTDRTQLTNLDITAELAIINNHIANIDTYNAAQVRDVVKRLLQENRVLVTAIRYIVKSLRSNGG